MEKDRQCLSLSGATELLSLILFYAKALEHLSSIIAGACAY
uniref:Bm1331 n=1 Tax=Brugia malayi TaxID=6279 RepID=A0A1I9G2D1_BRUMA|nr:Bm1331 [Brugia malayi]